MAVAARSFVVALGLACSGTLFAATPAPATPSAQVVEPMLVPRTYAHVTLTWEALEDGRWATRQEWKRPRLEAGKPERWDVTLEGASATQRLLLDTTWRGGAARVEIKGGYAWLEEGQAPVRVRVARGLADGDAWTFGVPNSREFAGHRVVAQVRLETVMEPWHAVSKSNL